MEVRAVDRRAGILGRDRLRIGDGCVADHLLDLCAGEPGTVHVLFLVFALVLIVAGGIREEVQRAFLLRRFERWLGGPRVGLVVTSAAFGAGHFVQGADAAVATAALGAFWGAVYLRRRSVAAPVVSHAGFNVLQVAQYLAFGR